ncbi:MAG: hypothetical protein ABW194_01270, partial [Novosphingobium sp.]
MLMVDSSADVAGLAEALPPALDAIAPGRLVGLVVAGEHDRLIAPRPWSPAQLTRINTAIAAIRFRGGQDDRPALAAAIRLVPRA